MHAHDRGRGRLLLAAHRGHLRAREALVEAARVTVGDQAVNDIDPGVGPERDGARGGEVDVVRVRGDHQGALDLGVVEHDPDPTDARPTARPLDRERGPRSGSGGRQRQDPCRRPSVQGRHDVLDPGVVLEPVHGQVLAVARVLEAAVRHLGDQRDVRVDPHAAEVQPAGHPHGAAVIGGPHRRRQPVLGPVRPGQRLVLGAELLDRDDRAEHLLLDDLVVLAQPGDHAGLEEVPAAADPVAAGAHLRMARQPVDEPADPGQLVLVVQRPEVGIGHIGAGHGLLPGLLDQGVGQVGGDARPGQHPRRSGAVLAGVEVPAIAMASAVLAGSASSNTMTGALPPSSRWTFLRSAAAAMATSTAGPDAPGDRDHLRHRVGDQRPAGVPVPADHVEHARRQELAHQLGQQQGGVRAWCRTA